MITLLACTIAIVLSPFLFPVHTPCPRLTLPALNLPHIGISLTVSVPYLPDIFCLPYSCTLPGPTWHKAAYSAACLVVITLTVPEETVSCINPCMTKLCGIKSSTLIRPSPARNKKWHLENEN